MATRSTIALEFADGTVQMVYCHWDGYLDHNGRILRDHYSDPFKLRDLIDLGDISSLGSEIGEKHAFSRLDIEMPAEEYEAKYGKMTTFYGRDRGETGVDARKFADITDYYDRAQREEYNYILRENGGWFVEFYLTDGQFMPLEEAFDQQAATEDA
jgi:hypothetical protein